MHPLVVNSLLDKVVIGIVGPLTSDLQTISPVVHKTFHTRFVSATQITAGTPANDGDIQSKYISEQLAKVSHPMMEISKEKSLRILSLVRPLYTHARRG